MALLLILFYLYVWLRIDTRLLYFWLGRGFPWFQCGVAFLKGFLVYPGGPVQYASAFLFQWFHYAWAGALIITAIAGLLCLGAWLFVSSVSDAAPRVLHFVPPLLVLVLYNRYACSLGMLVALVAAVAAVCLYARMPAHAGRLRPVAFLVLSAALYYVADGAFLLFALVCGIVELLANRRRILGLSYLLSAPAFPYIVGVLVLRLRITDAYWRTLPFHQDSDLRAAPFASCLYLFFLLVALGVGLRRALRSGAERSSDDLSEPAAPAVAKSPGESNLRLAAESAALVIVAAASLFFSSDRNLRTLFRVQFFGRARMWPQLLAAARDLPPEPYPLLAMWDANRALYHTGRLPHDMLSYRQHPLALLPSPELLDQAGMPYPGWMKVSDVLMELGRVNESEHMAYEALSFLGAHPYILKRLVLASGAKGNTEAARILLGALSKDLVYGSWARSYLERLKADPLLSSEPDVQRIRSLRVDRNVVGEPTVEEMLTQLLEKNPQNRMAFEYLMAHHLLSRRLDGIAANIGRLDDFGDAVIPRLYEEAILLYSDASGKEVDLHGRRISLDTMQRFRDFQQLLAWYSGDRSTAHRVLGARYGDSYLFYFVFGESGAAR